jgi:hypothetical protein
MKKIIKAVALACLLFGCSSHSTVTPETLTESYVNRMIKTYSGKQKINKEYLSSQAGEAIKEAWENGVKDKTDGMSEEYAREVIDYYKNFTKNQAGNVRAGEGVALGLIQFYGTMAPELSEAYWAGYTSQ